MRLLTRLVCVAVVFVLGLSMAAAMVSVPASSAGTQNVMDKLESGLRGQVGGLMSSSPDTELRVIVFMKESSATGLVGRAMAKAGADMTTECSSLGAVAASLRVKAILDIAAMDEVERVYLDQKKYTLPSDKSELGVTGTTLGAPAVTEASAIWWASTPSVMGADDVWANGITGEGVTVAVLDTGADEAQNDLIPALVAVKSFTGEEFHDVFGHGTSTAGLVAGRPVNDYVIPQWDGVVKAEGMAPGAKIMAGKVLDDTGYGWDSWIIAGIEWAVAGPDGDLSTPDGAQIISMSLGGLEVPNDGDDPASLALDWAAEHGVASFVAAGNEGMGQGTVSSAGVSETTVTVGASTMSKECALLNYWPLSDYDATYLIVKGWEDNHMIWWSGRGPTADGRIDPDVSAVGAWGPAPIPGNAIEMMFGGTSMATPVAAGIAALVIQAFTEKNGIAPSPEYIKDVLMGTAMDLGYGPAEQGAGRVDAVAAYDAVMSDWEPLGPTSVSLTVGAGESASVSFDEGTTLSSRVLQEVRSESQSQVCQKTVDWYYQFEVKEDETYFHADLAFDPTVLFTRDVHDLTNIGKYTDSHINVILYRLDDAGERTMINYAYAHANSQELNAKVTEGTYELRVSPVLHTVDFVPYDLQLKFFETVDWSWMTADDGIATISVPEDATPGFHLAFIDAAKDGTEMTVPVVLAVPLEIGVPAEGVIDVVHEVYGYSEGDWKYYLFEVPEDGIPTAITAVLSWTSWDTDIDMYLIDPTGTVVAASVTPFLGSGIFGPWTTTTGTTADAVSVFYPEPGMWTLGLHDVILDKVFDESYDLVVLPYAAAEFTAEKVTVKPGAPLTIGVRNNIGYPVGVGLVAVGDKLAESTVTYTGELTSTALSTTTVGYEEILFTVAPATTKLELEIDWADSASDLDVVVYAADGSNRGVLWESGDVLVVENPVPGVWEAVVAVKDTTSVAVPFSLIKTTTAFPTWDLVRLVTSSAWIQPGETASFVAYAQCAGAAGNGFIIAYDLVSGATYDMLVVTVK